MATRTVTATTTEAANFSQKLSDSADGPGKTPYIDGRELAVMLAQSSQFVYGSFTVGTTVDDDGDTIADADDIQINCGFVPKAIFFTMVDGASTELYVKFRGMEVTAIKNYSFLMVDGVAPAWTNNSIRFNNVAEDDNQYVTILNGITDNTKAHYFLILG